VFPAAPQGADGIDEPSSNRVDPGHRARCGSRLIFLSSNVRRLLPDRKRRWAWDASSASDDIAFPSDTPVEAGLAVTSHVRRPRLGDRRNFLERVRFADEDIWLDQDIGKRGPSPDRGSTTAAASDPSPVVRCSR